MKVKPDIDPNIRQAWNALNAQDAGQGPSAASDQKLRDYARSVPADRPWIWPVSLAASALLCLTFVYQFSQILTPEPLPPQAQASPTSAPLPVRDVAVGDTVEVHASVRDLRSWVELETAEDWWRQMRLHAQRADRDAFLATWRAYDEFQQGVPLPDDLRQWIVSNGLPQAPPG